MNKISYRDLVATFRAFNETNNVTTKGSGKAIYGVIVFTEDSFLEKYPEKSRSYLVSSSNKAFIPGQLGYSIFAGCLDGSDQGVRLEQYIDVEYGGEDGWHVDYCYMVDGEE